MSRTYTSTPDGFPAATTLIKFGRAFLLAILAVFIARLPALAASEATAVGYYRFPSLHGEVVVFTAEGDLWKASIKGGAAQRLTTHAGLEQLASISHDGKWLAFTAQYEGPLEVYVMPLSGGLPKRLTYEGETALVRGWTPDGRVMYSTLHQATLPHRIVNTIHPATGEATRIPLAQADEIVVSPDGSTIFFTRFAPQSSQAKRYSGGTAQSIWRYAPGDAEAKPLTGNYNGTSRWPMLSSNRIVFASDRDGTMNLWSMRMDGTDLRQHTRHTDFGVKNPSSHQGRVVYQNGADLWICDLSSDRTSKLSLSIASDFDQMREKWVRKPLDFLTESSLSPDGDRVALTVRGQVFVAPVGQGRLVELTRRSGVRYRQASFMPDGKNVLLLSDESGEVEFWKTAANGLASASQLTRDANTLRMRGIVSPDGKWLAYSERDQELWMMPLEGGEKRLIRRSQSVSFDSPDWAWSPDSRWLAFVDAPSRSGQSSVYLHEAASGKTLTATSVRVHSFSPAWSPDGKWLYFLSDRALQTVVPAPWGLYQPEPQFTKPTKIYMLALGAEQRSPFQPRDELAGRAQNDETGKNGKDSGDKDPMGMPSDGPKAKSSGASAAKTPVTVKLQEEGLQERLWEVPVPAGSYSGLEVADKCLFVTDRDGAKRRLAAIEIKTRDVELTTVLADVGNWSLSADRKKLLVRKGDELYVIDAAAKAPDKLEKSKVDLSSLKFSYQPRESWRQMFTDAWRLHRDYFYDKGMHGVDWRANLQKHLPLVERVTDRYELADALGYMMSELSALHTAVLPGEVRTGEDNVPVASLGAAFEPNAEPAGLRIAKIFGGDPDFLEQRAPIALPGINLRTGDILLAVNGKPVATGAELGAALRLQAGKQVHLRVQPVAGGAPIERIVKPLTAEEAASLRYASWEYERRLRVENAGSGNIGYVHLRAMGQNDMNQFAREFYPVHDRPGLVLDLRHNRGGNIDSWIISRLSRRAWMWWAPRDGDLYPNLQYAFRGHIAVLVDSGTASDGETLANGLRRLGLARLFGTRTWGGGVWLRSINTLVDKGIVTAAEFGTFIDGEGWTVEGTGLTPDEFVDNLPAATFSGKDAQLEAAIAWLKSQLAKDPRPQPKSPPPYPTPAKR